MTLPFTTEQFLAVFELYNHAIWPAQLVAYGLAGIVTVVLVRATGQRHRIALAILALFWAWNGAAYHWAFFAPLNPAAYAFGALFGVQALLFAAAAAGIFDVTFDTTPSPATWLGYAAIAYAALIYEGLGVLAGHGLMKGPLLGVAPCPTTIFTLGILLLARGRAVLWLSIIPLLWAGVGTSAALLLRVPEDYGLGIAALIVAIAIAVRRSTRESPVTRSRP